jgi:hypothetical protein
MRTLSRRIEDDASASPCQGEAIGIDEKGRTWIASGPSLLMLLGSQFGCTLT